MSNAPSPAIDRIAMVIMAIFVLSGATSLAYQVVWMRKLSLFFGSDVYAAAITLAVFMGGLSLGSWLAGRWGDRFSRPLLLYGLCEIIIGVYALFFPHLLDGLGDSYRQVYRAWFDAMPGLYHGFRLLVAAGLMLPPTLMMGATLPLIIRQFGAGDQRLGRLVGTFYAANTLGALGGTVVTGFVLLPRIGLQATLWVALAVNVVIGTAAVLIALKGGRIAATPAVRDRVEAPVGDDAARRTVLLVIGLSGLAAMALEVVWMRVLVHSFSATAYAFSIMVACFLFGIFYGSRASSRLIDGHPDPVAHLIGLEVGLGVLVTALAVIAQLVPGLFALLVWGLTGLTGGGFGVAFIIAQFVVAALLILWPTILLGMTFPAAVRLFTRDMDRRAHGTGMVYAANTVGAVLGSLLGGFVLLPVFGARPALLVIGLIFLATAGLLAASRRGAGETPRHRHPGLAAGAVAVALLWGVFALLPAQTVANFNLQKTTRPDVIYHHDGVSHTVDIIRNDAGDTIMMINGDVEGDTSLDQRRQFLLKAHLPLLAHPGSRDVAVVGLGLGITLAAAQRHPDVETIRLLEISPGMVAAHDHLREVTGGVLESGKIRLRIDDGRNFLAMTDEMFDMVTTDTMHPRMTNVGFLYTREYYQSIRRRLRPGGVVAQWMPMYRMTPRSFDVAFRTFAEVFPQATFYYVRRHGLFVARPDAPKINHASAAERFELPGVRSDLAGIGITSLAQLYGNLLMDADHVRRYLDRLGESRINTDDNAHLEYATPFEFLGTTEAIVQGLLPYAGWDPDRVFAAAPGAFIDATRRHFQQRLREIVPELEGPSSGASRVVVDN